MFVEDPDFEAQILAERRLNKILEDKAEEVVSLAGYLAAEQSGHYRRTLKASRVRNGRARASSPDVAGHIIEFGSIKNAAQAPLRRAADALCDGFAEEPKR